MGAVAEARDQQIPPEHVVLAILGNEEFPTEVKNNAVVIVQAVYKDFAGLTPDEIKAGAYGSCMKAITGIRREANEQWRAARG